MAILFYKINDEYGCFSNFSNHGFTSDGVFWSTSEHYFQAQKFADEAYKENIRLAKTPMIAATLGRDRSIKINDCWEQIKVDVMKKALFYKFTSHDDIKSVLLATGNEEIIEATNTDYFWGCGEKGTGENMLGKLLMQLRDELRK